MTQYLFFFIMASIFVTSQSEELQCDGRCVAGEYCTGRCDADYILCSHSVISKFEMYLCIRCRMRCNRCCSEGGGVDDLTGYHEPWIQYLWDVDVKHYLVDGETIRKIFSYTLLEYILWFWNHSTTIAGLATTGFLILIDLHCNSLQYIKFLAFIGTLKWLLLQ